MTNTHVYVARFIMKVAATNPLSRSLFRFTNLALTLVLLASCGGGGGGESDDSTAVEILFGITELFDPTPGISHNFGEHILILRNGNILVSDWGDGTNGTSSGAAHLFNGNNGEIIASYYGDQPNDGLAAGQLQEVGDDNFIIVLPVDDHAGITNAGSITLYDSNSGVQVGNKIAGDDAEDSIGMGDTPLSKRITVLDNGNFVVAATEDNVMGVADAGSVRLFSGNTGDQIGSALVGEFAQDRMGNAGIWPLFNDLFSRFVVISSLADSTSATTTFVDGGQLHIGLGTTGGFVKFLAGSDEDDYFLANITELPNGNFVMAAPFYDDLLTTDVGVVSLHSNASSLFGSFQLGTSRGELLGLGGITALTNNHYVIVSNHSQLGDIRLIDGVTSLPIDSDVGGFTGSNLLYTKITPFSNGNFAAMIPGYNPGGLPGAGRVELFNGINGATIGAPFVGSVRNSGLVRSPLLALSNQKFAFIAEEDLYLADSNDGTMFQAPIATVISGFGFGPAHGSSTTEPLVALENGNLVVSSPYDNPNGTSNSGSVILVDGTTGNEIGMPRIGNDINDFFGGTDIFGLPNSWYAIVSHLDDESGVTDAGTINLVDGADNQNLLNELVGTAKDDFLYTKFYGAEGKNFVVAGIPNANNNGLVDSGKTLIFRPSP